MTEIKLVRQSHNILYWPGNIGISATELIELAGRTCYKSEDKITEGSADKFVRMIRKRGHESVIEHASATVKFITNRGVTHELVRHRLAAYSQESTRYVNYGGKPMEFIIPVWTELPEITLQSFEDGTCECTTDCKNLAEQNWISACHRSASCYQSLLDEGWRPEQAREVLPNSLKTEIVMTANMREWRHVFKLRTSKAAHPQMRALMIPVLKKFQSLAPALFEDIEV